jgi:tRNA modification GTPase
MRALPARHAARERATVMPSGQQPLHLALVPVVDTIVARATPAGQGGIGIVRISGPLVPALAAGVLGTLPEPGRATRCRFLDSAGAPIDSGLALYFAAPRSFTGEHVLELHGHGGPVVMALLIERCLELGARAARPGEFSERAFLNDKLDLAQAEAVADLIGAGSAAAARAALNSLAGEFSAEVARLEAALIELRSYLEASIDFADEDLELLAEGGIEQRLARLESDFVALEAAAEQGRLLHDGCTLVLAGRPNAGKSSLLNALAGHDAAIVTPVPGTTRDVLRERIDIDGLPLTVLDTAGLREGPDEIEAEGIRRAEREMTRADRVLFVVDAADPGAIDGLVRDLAALPADVPVTVLANKSDVTRAATLPVAAERMVIQVSARTGAGLDLLRAHLKDVLGYRPPESGAFSARRRHVDALRRAHAHAASARAQLQARTGTELVAEELKLAHDALGEITGRFTSDDLLGRIFASFCIGK